MDIQYMIEIFPQFLSVIPITILIVVLSAIFGLLLSIPVAAIRIRRIPVLSQLMGAYISFTRSTPILLQLFLFFFGLPVLLQLIGFDITNIGAITAAVACLIFFNGAYMSEVLRPAYLAIDKGQHEAAESLGYTPFQKMKGIVIPQMAPIALPGLGNAMIHLIHDSSLVFAIGVVDVMGLATIMSGDTFGMKQVEVFLTVALIYWGISMVSEQIIRLLERRKKRVLRKTGYELKEEEARAAVFDILTVFESFVEILKVVPKTLLLALIILVLSFTLGAMITYIQSLNIPVVRQVIGVLQSFLRGTPNVVLLYLVYYSLPLVLAWFLGLFNVTFDPTSLNSTAIVIVTFSVCYSVFQSEIIRGALHSLDKDQIEAAQSLGYSTTQVLRKVIIPQVMVEALPDTMNAFLIIIKALSLAFLVTVVDIFAQARLVGAQSFSYLEAFVAAAFVYWGICVLLTYVIGKLENKMRRGYA